MDPNPPNNPTQGTPSHPGPDQPPKSGQNQPQIDEKSMKNVFPAKSSENSEEKRGKRFRGQNRPPPTTATTVTRPTPNNRAPPSASEKRYGTTTTNLVNDVNTVNGRDLIGSKTQDHWFETQRTTKSNKAKKGKKINLVTEDINTDSNSEYSSTSEKEDSTNQARFRKMNKVITELSKIPNSNLQGHPEVKAPLQHNWDKEHETKQCAIDMYRKEEAAWDLRAKLQTPSNKRPPESPTGATPEAKAAVHPSPGGTTQVRAEPALRSTVSTGNTAQMPKLTPPTGATSSPGGSGVSKEVGGGTGRGEHDSLPKRPPPLWRTH